MRCRPLVLAAALSAVTATPLALAAPPPPQTEAALLASAQQRAVDQASNPEHVRLHALRAPALAELQARGAQDPRREAEVDPFLAGWAPTRGSERDVSITNRYGARLHGHLSMPAGTSGRLPAVILLTGGAGPEHGYREIQHGLAEAGYVVLGLSVQNDAGSQAAAPDPDPSTPEDEYCQPGPWQEPQEAGVRETGTCAGRYEEPPPTVEEVRFTALRDDVAPITAFYEAVKARKLFGALDGVRWLLSADNPWRDRIDGQRIGIAGHSLGAHGALLAANADPQRRFRAAVTFDGFGRLAPTGVPTVPTLFQHQDLSDQPHRELPAAGLPGAQDAADFAAARVPTGVVHLSGSTHSEWSYVPPGFSTAFNASRDGKRVALHYAVAWFDLFLKPGAQADARRRLTAPVFDGSTDASSRGEGPWDPATQRTVHPTIGGETTQQHLSPLFRSWVSVPGARCADLRKGC